MFILYSEKKKWGIENFKLTLNKLHGAKKKRRYHNFYYFVKYVISLYFACYIKINDFMKGEKLL